MRTMKLILCLFLLGIYGQAGGQTLNTQCSGAITTELPYFSSMAANFTINEVYVTALMSGLIQVVDPRTCTLTRTIQLPGDAELAAFVKKLNGTLRPPPDGPFGPIGIAVSGKTGLIALSYSSIGFGIQTNFSGTLDGFVVIIDPATGSYRILDGGVNVSAHGLGFSPDGSTLYVGEDGSQGNTLALIDVPSGKITESLPSLGEINQFVTVPNGKVYGLGDALVSVHTDGTATIIQTPGLSLYGYTPGITVGPGNQVYVSAVSNGQRATVVIDGNTGQVVSTLSFGANVLSLPSSPSFVYLGILTKNGGEIIAYNLNKNQAVAAENGNPIYGMAVNGQPDGSDLIAILEDGVFKTDVHPLTAGAPRV